MNTFTLLLIAAALAVVKSASIRGSFVQSPQDTEESQRRHLLRESSCKLYQKCVTYLPDEDHPQGHHEETWVCQLSQEDSTRMGIQFVDLVETPELSSIIQNATSGDSMLTFTEAFVDPDSPRMYIPENAHMRVESAQIETRTEKRQRSLAFDKPSTTGHLKALVVRVIVNGKQPGISVNQLVDDVFEDSVSLSTQTQKCSYNKLRIDPFVGKTPSNSQVNNGVVNVNMNYDGDGRIDQFALDAATKQLGDLNDSMFDLVMFCFPAGVQNFLAFAYPNSKFSFYNDQWCGSVATQMHEVGHNLGLGHSGQVNEGEYGDLSGMMGNPGGGDDMNMCYNAQKNYQLGWYEDKTKSINPLDGSNSGNHDVVLNGVSDYQRNNNALIALRLVQTKLQTELKKQQDIYIGFNRATGINKDTVEDRNKVTITRKDYGAPDSYSQSLKLKSLSPGETYVLKNFNQERDIHITFLGLANGDARIRVRDLNPPNPTKAPTPAPTAPKATPAPTPTPGPCHQHTVEFRSDNYPGDNSWEILHGNHVVARSPTFGQKNKVYKTKVCLEVGKSFEFRFEDSHGDGLLGDSYYRIIEHCSNKVIVTSNEQNGTKFTESTHPIAKIETDCGANEPQPKCKNKGKRFRLGGSTGRKRSCKNLARKKKCNKKVSTGKYVWQVCQKSCKRCD